MIYRHTQVGTLLLCGLGFAAVAVLMHLLFGPGEGVARGIDAAVLGMILVCMFLFRSLSVQVTSEHVAVWFGPGWIRKVFRVEDIRKVRVVRNPWYYGWGIRLTPAGVLWNVSGFDAVELELQDGRRFRVGTDAARELWAAIQQARGMSVGVGRL